MNRFVLAAMLGLAASTAPAYAFTLSDLVPNSQRAAAASRPSQAPVIQVQGANESVRIQQLQDELRQLTGRVEEMSFQLLQMQEQIRKAQEDNEFRFQELEKSQRGSGSAPSVAAAPAAGSKKNSNDEVARIIDNPPQSSAGSTGTVAPPQTTLGSIEMDAKGAPVGGSINPNARNSASLPGVDTGSAPVRDQQQTASLGNEGDAYRAAYNHVLSGDYKLAESEFSSYLQSFPKSARAADANFWLGEAQYSQGKYNDSAKTFLNAHQAYGNSPKAPEMLLKLGMSLAALDNRETACATLREVPKRYPSAARPVLAKVSSEQKRLSC